MSPVGEYATQLVVGVGGRAGVSVAEVCALVEETLRGAGLATGSVKALATVESKAGEAGITGAAERFGVPLLSYPAEELAGICVPHPSDAARDAAGTSSVAEAAALAGGGELLVPKRRSVAATCAVATAQAHDLRHHGDAEVRGDGGALVDLAVNVRAHTPPEWLKQRIAASLGALSAYPDGRAARAAVAARHGLPADRVLLTAGAAEAFVLIARALGAQRPVVVHPQFTEPESALRDAGHTVERVLLRAADGFRLDPAAVPEDADLVVVGNPTNPTSVLHPAATLAALARPGRILVVDEAFMDAVPGEREALAGRTDVPGLVVLRSLTKTWGLAGLRIGYVLAEPEVIAKLAAAQPLWPVSTPALVAAEPAWPRRRWRRRRPRPGRWRWTGSTCWRGSRSSRRSRCRGWRPGRSSWSRWRAPRRSASGCAPSASRSAAGTPSRAWTTPGSAWRFGTVSRRAASSKPSTTPWP